MPYVVVQQDGAAKPVAEWRPLPPHVPDAEEREELRWTEVCGELVSRAAGKHKTSSFNVFLLFDRGELLEDCDWPGLGRLIERTRERCWGARLLLVLIKAPALSRIGRGTRADVAAWMKEALAGRISDVVQIDAGFESEDLWKILQNRASIVTRRHELLLSASGHRPWRCALPSNWLDTADFLGSGLASARADEQGAYDLVILLQGSTREEQEAEIDRHLAKDPTRQRRYRVVTYEHAPDRLHALQELCQEREIIQPVALEGDFELWYAMLRLNEQARTRWDEAESIHPVPLAPSSRFRIADGERLPAILLTSNFDAGEDQWLAAATDVGKFLHLAPPGVDYRVELAVGTQRLIEILTEMQTIDAWIHMGHGTRFEGLWTPHGGFLGPEKWADCFQAWADQKRELRLAMFLTCDSQEIARYFAGEGAGLAIGFEGDVESDTAGELAKRVLESMLTEGARGGRILGEFLSGEAWCQATHCLAARPRAYYPRRV